MAALGVRCRFSPSCSVYAKDALTQITLPAALLAIVWRLLRCAPWSAGGHDPLARAPSFLLRASSGSADLGDHCK